MTAPDFWLKKDLTSTARSMRLAIIQNQLDAGNLTEDEARELLAGPLEPGNEETVFDDSEWLGRYDASDPEWHPLSWTVIP